MSGREEGMKGAAAGSGPVTGGAGTAAEMGTGAQRCPGGELEGMPVPAFAVTSLSQARFEALHGAVRPRAASEQWRQIPWQPDLWQAREQAAREQKPLLLWVMDGHPLGCT